MRYPPRPSDSVDRPSGSRRIRAPNRGRELESERTTPRTTDWAPIHQPLADEPTIATVVGHDLIYVANSQWEKYDDQGRRKPGTTLAPTVLLALKIR